MVPVTVVLSRGSEDTCVRLSNCAWYPYDFCFSFWIALVQARGLRLFFLPSLSPSTEIRKLQVSCFSLC